MIENKLFASVALFRELYNENRDIYDILAELLRGALIYNSIKSINSISAKELLNSTYEFDIPEAVIKTVIKRLVKDKFLVKASLEYAVHGNRESNLHEQYDIKEKNYNKILKAIVTYINEKYNDQVVIDDVEKNFKSFLTDNGVEEKYNKYISSFIMSKNTDQSFLSSLNEIKEGLILYQGITYSPDIGQTKVWTNPLTIFLDTEYLFHAVGYNGILFQEVYNDFQVMVRKINSKKKLISLKYFEETKKDVENFFYAAEALIDGNKLPDPSKTAMLSIMDGCNSKSDILERKNKFFQTLKNMHIELEDKVDYYKNPYLNLEDENTIKSIKKDIDQRKKISDDEYKKAFSFFTKINVLRNAQNEGAFRDIGYIFATGKNFINNLNYRDEIKEMHDMFFSVNLDFIINRLWFRLNQGFKGFDKDSMPKSFDMVVRAQIILSSQINNTISEKYQDIKDRYDNGSLSKEEAVGLDSELRENIYKPENITEEKVDGILSFLTEDLIEVYKREQSLLKSKVEEGEKAKLELSNLEFKTKRNNQEKPKNRIACKYFIIDKLIVLFLSFTVVGFVYYAIKYSQGDSVTTITLAVYTILSLFSVGLIIIRKRLNSLFYKYKRIDYRKSLKSYNK